MTKLRRLKIDAIESSLFRGHNMSRFELTSKSKGFEIHGRNEVWSYCKDCGARVYVNTRPLPNDIEISGTAVAIGCEDNR